MIQRSYTVEELKEKPFLILSVFKVLINGCVMGDRRIPTRVKGENL